MTKKICLICLFICSIWQDSYMLRRGKRKQKPTPREIDNAKKKEFPEWFKNYVSTTLFERNFMQNFVMVINNKWMEFAYIATIL